MKRRKKIRKVIIVQELASNLVPLNEFPYVFGNRIKVFEYLKRLGVLETLYNGREIGHYDYWCKLIARMEPDPVLVRIRTTGKIRRFRIKLIEMDN